MAITLPNGFTAQGSYGNISVGVTNAIAAAAIQVQLQVLYDLLAVQAASATGSTPSKEPEFDRIQAESRLQLQAEIYGLSTAIAAAPSA